MSGPRQSEEGRADVARNALHLVGGQVATTALAIVLSAALGRLLGAKDFGVFFLIATMSTFAYVLVEWGQQLFVIREIARAPEQSGRLVGSAIALRIGGAIVVLLPTLLVAWALGYEPRTRWLAVTFILVSLPFSLAQTIGMAFRGRDMMARDATISVVNKTLTLGFALPALYLHHGIPGVLVAQGVAGLAALAVAWWLYRRIAAPRLRVTAHAAGAILIGGSPILAMTVATSVQPYIDAVLLSKLVPEVAVGWFGAARNVMGTLVAPALILAAATYPSLSRTIGDPGSFRAGLRSALRPLLWLGALGGVGTYLFADLAIGIIYGSKGFAESAVILKAFAPVLILLFVDVLMGHAITALGRAKAFAVAKAASIVVSTALSLYLVPAFQRNSGNGGIGLVVAFALSEVVMFGSAVFLLPRRSFDPALLMDAGRAVGAAAATLLLFRMLPGMPPYVGLPLCIVAFSAASVAVGLVTRRDLDTLKILLRRLRPAQEPAPGP